MLTGQRVQEVAQLHVKQWDRTAQIIDWARTKNTLPHAIPLPSLAVALLESLTPSREGWLFPSAMDRSKPVSHGTLYSFLWRQRDRGVIPFVTNRDLRRTFKTLAGKAGVPKEIRDRLQNHALQDVNSKNYDRWSYMPEKQTGMEKWDAFVRALLAREDSAKRTVALAREAQSSRASGVRRPNPADPRLGTRAGRGRYRAQRLCPRSHPGDRAGSGKRRLGYRVRARTFER